jgi:hypothetical protein
VDPAPHPLLCLHLFCSSLAAAAAAARYLTNGAPEAVFLVAPLLLLLSQDPLLLRRLGEEQRYAPPLAAVAGYLTLTAAREVGGGSCPDGHACVGWLLPCVYCLQLQP